VTSKEHAYSIYSSVSTFMMVLLCGQRYTFDEVSLVSNGSKLAVDYWLVVTRGHMVHMLSIPSLFLLRGRAR
jgi:uncharacterized membrane protein YjdF